MKYLSRKPPLVVAGKGNPLIHNSDWQMMMLSRAGRILVKSAVDLISSNRLRGYCISRSLVEDNLVVSSLYGTFGLRRPIADDVPDNPNHFVGFKALKRLFLSLVTKMYGNNAQDYFLSDIHDWLNSLDSPDDIDGLIPTYHPCMLPDEGRAWLSIRLAQLLTVERSSKGKISQFVFRHLQDQSLNLSERHGFFKEWLDHSATLKENMDKWLSAPDLSIEESEESRGDGSEQSRGDGSEQSRGDGSDEYEGGRALVMMNRNGILHSQSKALKNIAGTRYSTNNVVDLLHCHLPLYLPVALWACKVKELWGVIDMNCYFPKVVIYPRMKNKK